MSMFRAARTYLKYGAAATQTRVPSIRAEPWTKVWYVVEPRDWSVQWDGTYISGHARKLGVEAHTTLMPSGVKSQVVHYGSRSLFLQGRRLRCDDSNRVVFTWFHGSEADASPANQRMIELVPEASEQADLVVTSSTIARNRLVGWGVDAGKMRVVPLGVDSSMFSPADAGARELVRDRLGIPRDALCVGSFHKDGEGWDDGDKPKYEKAPEVLVEALHGLARAMAPRQVYVLLTGPARGFVKAGLEKAGVPYTHIEVSDFRLVPPMYHALDMYLIPSRDEGGPKGLLEAMASGIPVVSTRVGMVADIVENSGNGVVVEPEDVNGLVSGMRWLAEDRAAYERIALNGRRLAERHDWSVIAARYVNELYLALLEAGHSGVPVTGFNPASQEGQRAA